MEVKGQNEENDDEQLVACINYALELDGGIVVMVEVEPREFGDDGGDGGRVAAVVPSLIFSGVAWS